MDMLVVRAAVAVFSIVFFQSGAFALVADEVNSRTFTSQREAKGNRPSAPSPTILKAQVLLDRQRVSPGAIDGLDGENFQKALAELRRRENLPAGEGLDQVVWDALKATKQRIF